MRGLALGLCVTVATLVAASSAGAASYPKSSKPDSYERSTPASINDHDGSFVPRPNQDRGFTINPDGDTANYSPDADQDEDGSDEEIYQGEDDQLPA